MRILEYKVENLKKIKSAEIKLDKKDNMILVCGNNAQGKSSMLDGISYIFAGKKAQCQKPIREGEKKAIAEVVVSDGDKKFTIKRTFTEKGGTLSITTDDGASFSSPQTFVDSMYEKNTVDPLAFANEKPENQKKILQDLVGINFDDLDEKYNELYSERTFINREVKNQKSIVDSLSSLEEVEYVSISELSNEMSRMTEMNQKRYNLEKKNEEVSRFIHNSKERIVDKKNQIEKLKSEIEEIEHHISDAVKEQDKNAKEIAETPHCDLSEVKKQISEAEETNRKHEKWKEKVQAEKSLEQKQKESQSLTDRLEAISEEKQKALDNAQFPIEGLSFDVNGIVYNGLPLDQASDAERLRVCLSIGLALNKKEQETNNKRLNLLMIRQGSLLDEKSLSIVDELATKFDAQVFVEIVGEEKKGKCQIIFRDGEIV